MPINYQCVATSSASWLRQFAGVNAERGSTASVRASSQPLANDELNGPRGEGYRKTIEAAPAKRAGTADEIGTLGALLMGPDGAFISGSDFLIDGGATASYRYGQLAPEL